MLTFTQGDNVVLKMTAQMSDGTLIDLTGASFVTRMRKIDNTVVSFPNGQHVANPDQVGHKGQFTLTLSTSDSNSVRAAIDQEIVTQITIMGNVINYHGLNMMNVLPSDPIPV